MGIKDWVKSRLKGGLNYKHADMLNGFTPIFSQFGNDIYASDVVQQAVMCIVTELMKLNPQHIRKNERDLASVNGDIQRVLKNPNEFMTLSDFLSKIGYQLFANYNSFIIPTWVMETGDDGAAKRRLTGLYPIQPTQVDFMQDPNGKMVVKFTFANNYNTTIAMDDVIHIKYRYSVNEFMGGDERGQPNNDALLKTLELNDTLLQGVAKSLKTSFAVNGVVKYNTMLDDGKMEENVKELQNRLQKNESGLMSMDIKGDFIPIKRDIKLIDNDTLKFIDNKILRGFGVPLAVLIGDYTKTQYEAFYQKTLEPIVIALSQAFTKALFTARERSFGNEIVFYTRELIFMTTQEKLEMIRLLGDSGDLYENEKRAAFGIPPLEELEGVRMQSLNYVDASIAKDYQLNIQKGENEEDEGNGEK